MTDEFVSQLLDFGALGLFAGFLIWQHLGMQKRLDKLTHSFQEQLREIDREYDGRIDRIRERYDEVIVNMRQETMTVQGSILSKLDAALSKLDEGLEEVRRRRR